MAGITIRDIGILFGYEVDRASEDRVEASVQNLKNFASNALGAIGLTLSIAGITSAIKDCVSLASEVEEMENKFNVVFQGINEEVDAWAQNYADAIGRNKNDIKTYLADQQNLLVGFGMAREEGAKLAEEMTSLALDLASFGNLDEASAVNNMTKAVMGESEAAKGLGAVLNDVTRAEAMLDLGLSGTYDKLDQLTKMQVNYHAILSQSPDAIGDCERSLDSYQSTLKQFEAKLKEIKTIIGQFFMPTAQKILRFGAQGLTMLRDFVMRISGFVDSIGGAEAVLAILSSTLAGMFAVMNIGKLGAAVGAFAKLASTLGLAAAKATILFTSVLLVVLLIQDFISFMQGKDSVIGVMFEKSGVDCDALRDKVRDTWNNIKSVFETVSGIIKNTAGRLFSAIRGFWDEYGDDISGKVASTVTGVVDKLNQFSKWLADNWGAVTKVAAAIGKLAAVFFVTKGVTGKVAGAVKKVSDVFGKVKGVIGPAVETFKNAGGGIKGLGAVFKSLVSPVGIAVIAIAAIAAVLFDLFNFMIGKNSVIGVIFEKLGVDSEAAREKLTAAWEGIRSFLLSAWETIKSVATSIWGGLKNYWDGHGEQIKSALVNTWTIIKNLLIDSWNALKTVATVIFGALKVFWDTWGSTIIAYFSGMWEVMKSVFGTALNVLTDFSA